MPSDVPADYAQRLLQFRSDRGWSQQHLADLLGVSFATINRWEGGRVRPSPSAWRQFLRLEAEGQGYALPDERRSEGEQDITAPFTILPRPVSSFIGRERELAFVVAQLQRTRLLSLCGAGGSGKTRLALEAAGHMEQAFGDGVRLVELAALADSVQVPRAVAGALGLREQPGRPLSETLVDALRPRSLLLVLDNCEHLIAACASLADLLLQRCPHLSILATSREPLGSPGEVVWRIPPLSVPDSGAHTIDEWTASEAVRLFVARATEHHAEFRLDAGTAPAVADICQRLDGLPLAIELAAGRVPTLTVHEIARRLDDRLRLLSVGNRTADPRHQTLRTAIDWSCSLLSAAEQTLFMRLSVFSGGFDLAAVEAACTDDTLPRVEVLDLLGRLIAKSLVMTLPAGETETRFRLLETLREYTLERLTEAGAATTAEQRHAAYYLSLAEAAERHHTEPTEEVWITRLERELDNLRTALRWLAGQGEAELYLRLAGALGWFWELRGHLTEGRSWLAGGPEDAHVPHAVRAKALERAGGLAAEQGDYEPAQRLLEASLASWRRADDDRGVARTLRILADVAYQRGEYATAQALDEDGLELARASGDQASACMILRDLGYIAHIAGDLVAARTRYEEGQALCQKLGDPALQADLRNALGKLAYDEGDFATARAMHLENIQACESLGYTVGLALAHINLAFLDRVEGSHRLACVRLQTVARAAVDAGNQRGLGNMLGWLGLIAVDRQQPRRGTQLMSRAESLLAAIGASVNPWYRTEYDAAKACAQAALGSTSFAAESAVGAAMPLDEAVRFALEDADEPEVSANWKQSIHDRTTGWTGLSGGLTAREVEVLRLIASGSSNREVAESLVVSVRTVERHITNIYTKIGARGKADATAYALRHGLAAPQA